MRVLHVVATGQRRGAEMFASDLVRALGTHGGVEQEVAILRGPWPTEVPFDAPVVPMRVNGRRIPGLRMDLATLRSLRGTIARYRPQVLHAHGGEPFKYLALAAAGRSIPLVYRRIGIAPGEITSGIERAKQAALLRQADLIVAVAESVRAEAVQTFGVPEDRVVTIPRGIDPLRLAPERGRSIVRNELGIPASAPVLLYLGALSPEKDPMAHVELCATIVRSMPEAIYLFAGDGPMRREIEDAVRERELEPNVRLLGSRPDVGDLLAATDVLVLASRLEGMPGCVIEAGMAGVPVAAFRVAGVPEIVADGETGYVVEPGDHAGLAERALKLLRDEGLRREMGEAAVVRCVAAFDIGGIAGRYAEIYARLAAS